jgi:hypothetical protein
MFRINAKWKPYTFLNELKKRAEAMPDFIGAGIAGDNLDWIIYQEFGTATKLDHEANRYSIPKELWKSGGEAYPIYPHGNYKLRFPDPTGKYKGEHDEDGNVYLNMVPSSDARAFKSHPGIRPAHFIRDVLEQIRANVRKHVYVVITDSSNPYDFQKLNEELFQSAVETKEIIAVSIEAALPNTRVDGGKLHGLSAAAAFRSEAQIKELAGENLSSGE